MSLFSDGELRLRLLLRRLLCASLVLRGDKRGRSLKAAPLSGCWRRLLIGKMLIFFLIRRRIMALIFQEYLTLR